MVAATTLCPRSQRQGDVPGLVAVADPHRAGDFAQRAGELVAVEDDGVVSLVMARGQRKFLVGERVRAQLRGGGIGLLIQGDQLCGVAVEDFKQRAQDFVVAGDAGLVVLEHVHLDQQAGTVFEDHLAGGEAGRIGDVGEALGGIGVVIEVDERGEGEMAGGVDLALEFGRDGFAQPARNAGGHVGGGVGVEGDVVLEVGAVGDVVVDEEVGHPAVEHFEEGAGFGGVGLEVVAIEIDVGAVAAPANDFGAVLVDAVVRGAALVAVEVVDGDEDEDDVIEQRSVRSW